MRLVSVEEQIQFNGQTKVINRNTLNFTLAKGLQLSLSQTNPAAILSAKLSGKGWSLRHDSPTTDTVAGVQRAFLGGKLEVTQTVPGGRWFLVPTPAFKLSRSFATERALARLSCRWDTLLPRGQLAQTVYCGPDCAYKASLQLDTWLALVMIEVPGQAATIDQPEQQGAAVSARAKLRTGAVQSVAAAYSGAMGPVLCVKSRPLAGLKLRADARLRARVLAARAQAVPYFLGAAPPLALTLDVTAPWGAGAGDAKRRGAAVLGIKLRV